MRKRLVDEQEKMWDFIGMQLVGLSQDREGIPDLDGKLWGRWGDGEDDGDRIGEEGEVRSGGSTDADLGDQGGLGEDGLEFLGSDEFGLRQLEDVGATIQDPEGPGISNLHDISCGKPGFGLAFPRGPVGITGKHGRGLDKQLAARVGAIGAKIAEFWHIAELEADIRIDLHVMIGDLAALGAAVALVKRASPGFDQKTAHAAAQERAARAEGDHAVAEHGSHLLDGAVPQLGAGQRIDGCVGQLSSSGAIREEFGKIVCFLDHQQTLELGKHDIPDARTPSKSRRLQGLHVGEQAARVVGGESILSPGKEGLVVFLSRGHVRVR